MQFQEDIPLERKDLNNKVFRLETEDLNGNKKHDQNKKVFH